MSKQLHKALALVVCCAAVLVASAAATVADPSAVNTAAAMPMHPDLLDFIQLPAAGVDEPTAGRKLLQAGGGLFQEGEGMQPGERRLCCLCSAACICRGPLSLLLCSLNAPPPPLTHTHTRARTPTPAHNNTGPFTFDGFDFGYGGIRPGGGFFDGFGVNIYRLLFGSFLNQVCV